MTLLVAAGAYLIGRDGATAPLNARSLRDVSGRNSNETAMALVQDIPDTLVRAAQEGDAAALSRSEKLLGFGNVPLELTTFVDRISLPGEGASASVGVTLDGPTARILRTLVSVPDGRPWYSERHARSRTGGRSFWS